jgi:hypothetical protein
LFFLTNQVFGGYAYVIEEDFIDLGKNHRSGRWALQRFPGDFISMSKKANAFLLFNRVYPWRTRQNIQSAYWTERIPGLGTIDDILIAITKPLWFFREARSDPAFGSE